MCNIIFLADREITNVSELQHFFEEIIQNKHYSSIDSEFCLCQVDIEKTILAKFPDAKITRDEFGDYHVNKDCVDFRKEDYRRYE